MGVKAVKVSKAATEVKGVDFSKLAAKVKAVKVSKAATEVKGVDFSKLASKDKVVKVSQVKFEKVAKAVTSSEIEDQVTTKEEKFLDSLVKVQSVKKELKADIKKNVNGSDNVTDIMVEDDDEE